MKEKYILKSYKQNTRDEQELDLSNTEIKLLYDIEDPNQKLNYDRIFLNKNIHNNQNSQGYNSSSNPNFNTNNFEPEQEGIQCAQQ